MILSNSLTPFGPKDSHFGARVSEPITLRWYQDEWISIDLIHAYLHTDLFCTSYDKQRISLDPPRWMAQ